MSTETLTQGQYVQHHLEHLSLSLKTWTLDGHGFWVINLDTLFVSILVGLLIFGMLGMVARSVTSGVPGKLQNFAEVMLDFVGQSVKESFHGDSSLIAPLALVIFLWVFFLNT